eukprot:TRINITY_DN12709_c0_g1_i2.p1 TRINITY_DN12709_c0_g1~~TRINITY_DN12709_c0_g1_i2.p1  ORF type:complete len:237 (-),score=69.43 TRINITY_DN12709_c0_g1_i2:131-841(-)
MCIRDRYQRRVRDLKRPMMGAGCCSAANNVPLSPLPKMEQSTEPQMEQDSAASEEVDYNALILPDGKFPTHVSRFALGVNYDLLHGWVKQPSPCCAAASVAGAVNCIRGHKRWDAGAIGHLQVLEVMAGILTEQAEKLQGSAERCLGAPLAPLEAALAASLAGDGLTLDRKECTKKLVLGKMREVVATECQREGAEACYPLLKALIDAEAPVAVEEDDEGSDAEPAAEPVLSLIHI